MTVATTCPVCWRKVNFHTWRNRAEERCPRCKALRRHRQDWLYMKRVLRIDKVRGRMLHTAPEQGLYEKLSQLPALDYTTCDIVKGKAVMHQVDLTTCERYLDDSFDYIYSSHVLEHIPNLSAALGALYRVTNRGGRVILQVPLTKGPTFIHPAAIDSESRKEHHGHPDHMRCPGTDDWHEVLAEPGWNVEVAYIRDFVSPSEAKRFAVNLSAPVYVCTK